MFHTKEDENVNPLVEILLNFHFPNCFNGGKLRHNPDSFKMLKITRGKPNNELWKKI